MDSASPPVSNRVENKKAPPKPPVILKLAADPRVYIWLGLLLAMVCVFKAIPSSSTVIWISSDTLWPVDLFIDTLHDGYSFHGWMFSIAPCWFPDIFIVGLCYLLLRNPILTTLVAGSVQFMVLLAGLCLCWRALKLDRLKLLDMLTVGSGLAIVMWIAFHTATLYPGVYQFLLPQTHVGNLIMHVYAIWLALLLIELPQGRKRTIVGVGYTILCLLAGLSNLMFFPHTLLPLSIAAAVLVVARAAPLRRVALPALLAWPAAAAGAAAYRLLFPAMDVGAQSLIGYEAWRTAIRTFLEGASTLYARFDLLHVMAALWLVACVILGSILLWRVLGERRVHRERTLLFVIFLFTSVGASVLGPATMIAGGSNGLTQLHNYEWTMHYMHPTFLLPLLAWPSLIGFAPTLNIRGAALRATAASVATASMAFPFVAFERIPHPPVPVWQYAPDFVRALDRDASRFSLKYGLAGYWQARIITLLSRTGLRVYPLNGSMQPFLIVSNREWYTRSLGRPSQAPCFSFVVLNDPLWRLTRAAAIDRGGEPSYEIDAAGVPVLVYAAGTAGHAMPRCDAFSFTEIEMSGPHVAMDRRLTRYMSDLSSPMASLRGATSQRMRIPVRIGNSGSEPWSSVGKFPITLSYKWFSDGRMLPIEGERTLLPGDLMPGKTTTLSAVVVMPPEPGAYTLRFSLVQEGVTWFMSAGSKPMTLPVTVTGSAQRQ
jgi:hypothetical protein